MAGRLIWDREQNRRGSIPRARREGVGETGLSPIAIVYLYPPRKRGRQELTTCQSAQKMSRFPAWEVSRFRSYPTEGA